MPVLPARGSYANDRLLFSHRYAALTRAQLLARQGRSAEALAHTDQALTLADQAKELARERARHTIFLEN